MKNILAIISLLLLTSCGVNDEIKIKEIETNTWIIYKNNEWELNIKNIEKKIEKLNDVKLDSMELDEINSTITNIYNNKIEIMSLSDNDIKKCDKINTKNWIENCKKRFFIAKNDFKSCDLLLEKDFQRSCKNTIIEKEASKKLDEKLCENLIFQEQQSPDWEKDLLLDYWKLQIQDCKNRILIEKAISKKDYKICNDINIEWGKWNCIELVKMEIGNWKLSELPFIEDYSSSIK